MNRRLLNVSLFLSLLLCAATAVAWARSRRTNDGVYYCGDTQILELHQAHGVLLAGWGQKLHKESSGWSHGVRPVFRREVYSGAWRTHGGFAVYCEAMSSNCCAGNVWRVAVPHWFAGAVFALPSAAFAVAAVRAKRRQRDGCCHACGYDLRATPSRCPECGGLAAA